MGRSLLRQRFERVHELTGQGTVAPSSTWLNKTWVLNVRSKVGMPTRRLLEGRRWG